MQAMRDIFFDMLYQKAVYDKNVILISVDLGAPSLDKFRETIPEQFINVGISEQNAILTATGMALAGKRVYVYGITEFITMRCLEQIKLYVCGMNLPIVILGIGAGVSFSCDGMTHHCIEQLSIIRSLPNIRLINCSDNQVVRDAFEFTWKNATPALIMFEKDRIDCLWQRSINLEKGFSTECIDKQKPKIMLVASGIMTKEAKRIKERFNNDRRVGVIDVFGFPVNELLFLKCIEGVKLIVTLEENTYNGGLGSYVCEMLADAEVNTRIKRFALNTKSGYGASYLYPSRENIRSGYGLSIEKVILLVREELECN